MVGLSKYAFRRYDNYVLLSSANLSLILGALLGIASRLSVFALYPAFSWGEHETMWLILVSVATLILIYFIYVGVQRVVQDHKAIHDAIIRGLITDLEIDENRLKKIFPEYFKEQPENI